MPKVVESSAGTAGKKEEAVLARYRERLARLGPQKKKTDEEIAQARKAKAEMDAAFERSKEGWKIAKDLVTYYRAQAAVENARNEIVADYKQGLENELVATCEEGVQELDRISRQFSKL